MTRSYAFPVILATLCANTVAGASDLKVTILPHTDSVVFGDPLYVEVTLTNHGDKPVAGPGPSLMLGSLAFVISDARGQLSYTTACGGGFGGLGMVVFEPERPVKYYFTLMLPKYHRYDHAFWKPYQDGGDAFVHAVYRPNPGGVVIAEPPKGVPVVTAHGVQIVSGAHRVHLAARPDWQIERLRFWATREYDREDYQKGPVPADLHLPVQVANRDEIETFSFDTLLDGELGSLAVLSLKIRDIYELQPDDRAEANQKLVEWLRKEPEMEKAGEYYMKRTAEGGQEPIRLRPEIRRQTLAREVNGLARACNMRSTVEALEAIIKEE